MEEIQSIIEKLSPLERKIIPYLKDAFHLLKEKSGLDETSLLRGLKFLENKNVIKLNTKTDMLIELGVNGVFYKKNNLPERILITVLETKSPLTLEEAKKLSKLSENEFKVSLGVLKGKALISVVNGKISLNASKEELMKKSLEEQFLEILPIEQEKLSSEQKFAFENLKKRKDIVFLKPRNAYLIELTELGNKIAGKEFKNDLIEEVTPEIIKSDQKNIKFRKYDIFAPVPRMYGGKRHFVNEAISKGRKIWLEMGFKEMEGNLTVSSFWNFDALFTAQDHPVREMHDTFFIKNTLGKLPNQQIVKKVKEAHEKGVGGSKGWKYNWSEENAKRVLLRTHTTCLSSQTLAKLKKEDLPAKYFAIGKVFRNETVDWSHGFEFNQTEGIVVDPNANLRHLIGYLKQFAKKMGYKDVKIYPSFFPYTEPSVEGYVWNDQRKQWVEVLAAGIFRPEVTIPLLGIATPVLAWGPGFDRLMMAAYQISDMREIYSNDIKQLREKKYWV